jgi:hypothetical protein
MLSLDKGNKYNELQQRLVSIIGWPEEREEEFSLKQTQRLLFELYNETLPIKEGYDKIVESARKIYNEHFSGEYIPQIKDKEKINYKN